MKRINYQQAYDLIIQAYFKDEIKPMESDFCFCGTLTGGKEWVGFNAKYSNTPYTECEYFRMEYALLKRLRRFGIFYVGEGLIPGYLIPGKWCGALRTDEVEYEEALFQGMCDALAVLQEIHKGRGEVIDDVPVFTKREKTVAV